MLIDEDDIYLNNIYLDTTSSSTATITTNGTLTTTTNTDYQIYTDTAYTYAWEDNSVDSVLDRMELKDIEQYIRRKKLKNIKKNGNKM
jgi:hypothetical protein